VLFLVVVWLMLAAVIWPGASSDQLTPPLQAAGTIQLELVRSGYANPVFVTHAGDSRLFVVEQGGAIKVDDGATVSTFLNMSSRITTGGSEQGLLGLAFDPDYATNRRFYVMYTASNGDNTISQVLRSTSNANAADPNSFSDLLRIPDFATNHNGGMLAFKDGLLYAGTGDGGGSGDPQGNGQKRNARLGKILRLDVDNAPSWVAAGNPFIGVPNTDPLVWAYGFRNPWRFSFDRGTGDLFVADVGQNAWEEVSRQPASSDGGENYGWKVFEGTHCFTSAAECSALNGEVMPIHEYAHGLGDCSITGGYVYRGSLAPSLVGKYIYGDYCSGRVWTLTNNGGTWASALLFDTTYSISSFGEDNSGELYLVHRGGSIYRFSETGLPTSTPTRTAPATSTVAPAATATHTAVPAATFTPTIVPAVATATPTAVPATATRLPATPTATATRVPVAATATATRTPTRPPASATPTRTPTRSVPFFSPDLVITSFTASSAPSNQGVPVRITIRNQGWANTRSSFDLHFFVDLGRPPTAADANYVGHVGVATLRLSASRTHNVTMFPGAIPPGTHQLYVMVDGHDIIVERNESNNTAVTTVNVTAPQ
jgi:glucose/arabinose dehydrogenase